MNFQNPYPGGGPLPLSGGNVALGVFLVDPVSGEPITPAGTSAGGSSSNPAGLSANGSVGTTSAFIATAGQYPRWMTIQNTHASNILYVAFGTATTSSFGIPPGGALTLPSGFSNGLSAIGSAAGTTYAIIGY